MISDVLSDAEDEIRRYMTWPNYRDDAAFTARINALLDEMAAVRKMLDGRLIPDAPNGAAR